MILDSKEFCNLTSDQHIQHVTLNSNIAVLSAMGMHHLSRMSENETEKKNALNLIISNYTKQSPEMTIEAVKDTVVIKVDIKRMTGRVYGY
jgi:hypothetical protein